MRSDNLNSFRVERGSIWRALIRECNTPTSEEHCHSFFNDSNFRNFEKLYKRHRNALNRDSPIEIHRRIEITRHARNLLICGIIIRAVENFLDALSAHTCHIRSIVVFQYRTTSTITFVKVLI